MKPQLEKIALSAPVSKDPVSHMPYRSLEYGTEIAEYSGVIKTKQR